MPIELKICGINSKETIETIIKNGGCQYLGFVFYPPSPRNLSIENSKKLTLLVPSNIKKVAVLVKPKKEFVNQIKDQFDYLQLYHVYPQETAELKFLSQKKIIQAIKIKSKEDINLYNQYVNIADEFLFDSSSMEKSSSFDWDYLRGIKIKRWFLAGGININNLEKAKNITQKIDISSSLEDNPGKKSAKKISDFLQKVKKIC